MPPSKNGAAAKPAPAAKPAAGSVGQIHVQRIKVKRIVVPIVGVTPLIVNRWTEKAKRQILGGQTGVKKIKENRDPEADYQNSIYRTEEGAESPYGFPVLGFKSAIVSGGRFFGKDLPMTAIRQFLFMTGSASNDNSQLLVPILDAEPHMREDPVKIPGSADLRYRAEFTGWRAELDITYVESKLSQDTVLALIDAAGLGVGVGDWRPEKSGMSGTFELDEDREIRVIR